MMDIELQRRLDRIEKTLDQIIKRLEKKEEEQELLAVKAKVLQLGSVLREAGIGHVFIDEKRSSVILVIFNVGEIRIENPTVDQLLVCESFCGKKVVEPVDMQTVASRLRSAGFKVEFYSRRGQL